MKIKPQLIVIEGIDGAGKDTQMNRLADKLVSKSLKVYTTAEPTNQTPEGRKILQLLKKEIGEMDKKYLLSLYVADRIHHTKTIKNKLQDHTVFTSRYDLSSFAYQQESLGDTNSLEAIYQAHGYDKGKCLIPDLTFYFDLDSETAMERIKNRPEKEGFEKLELLSKIRQQYLTAIDFLEGKDQRKIIKIDSTQSPDIIFDQLLSYLNI